MEVGHCWWHYPGGITLTLVAGFSLSETTVGCRLLVNVLVNLLGCWFTLMCCGTRHFVAVNGVKIGRYGEQEKYSTVQYLLYSMCRTV